MKKIVLGAIYFYQVVISIIIKNLLGSSRLCRFSPTCSEYAKAEIKKKGILKGSVVALKRLAKCHPFSKQV